MEDYRTDYYDRVDQSILELSSYNCVNYYDYGYVSQGNLCDGQYCPTGQNYECSSGSCCSYECGYSSTCVNEAAAMWGSIISFIIFVMCCCCICKCIANSAKRSRERQAQLRHQQANAAQSDGRV